MFEPAIIEVAENVYTAIGHQVSANTMIVGDDGVVIVDPGQQVAGARQVRAEFERIADLPVRAIIYTHGHADHVNGAAAFYEPDAGIEVWARSNSWSEPNRVAAAGLTGGARPSNTQGFDLRPEQKISVGIAIPPERPPAGSNQVDGRGPAGAARPDCADAYVFGRAGVPADRRHRPGSGGGPGRDGGPALCLAARAARRIRRRQLLSILAKRLSSAGHGAPLGPRLDLEYRQHGSGEPVARGRRSYDADARQRGRGADELPRRHAVGAGPHDRRREAVPDAGRAGRICGSATPSCGTRLPGGLLRQRLGHRARHLCPGSRLVRRRSAEPPPREPVAAVGTDGGTRGRRRRPVGESPGSHDGRRSSGRRAVGAARDSAAPRRSRSQSS